MFGEVAPGVARIQVMDVSGHVIALGSGVVIDKAVVLTNCHVAKRGVKLTVKVGDAVMPATIPKIEELTSGKMVLHGPDQSIACER